MKMENGIYRVKFHTKEGHFRNGSTHTLYLVSHFKDGKMDGGAFFHSKDGKWRSNPMRFRHGEYVYESKVEKILGNAWTNRDREWKPVLLTSDSELKSFVKFMKNGTLDRNADAVDGMCQLITGSGLVP